jgi:uncharacterized protein DUF6600
METSEWRNDTMRINGIRSAVPGLENRGRTMRRRLLHLMAFLLAGVLPVPLFAQDTAANPPGRVARLSVVEGKVSLQVAGSDQWSEASRNYPLTTGDRLYTDQGGRAELQVGPFAVRLSEGTDLTLANLTDQLMQLGLGQGTIRVSVFAMPPGNSVEVDTPNGALTLVEPGSYRMDADPSGNGTLVIINRGSLQVSGGGADQRLERGQAAKLTGTESVQVDLVSPPSSDSFDGWSRERDRRLESAPSAEYVGRGVPGYDDLDEYGRWETLPEYGPVWHPVAVPADWVPYRYGRWVWVEPWGWTWVEDEPWGFCPFHYGRWVLIGPRWCWIPGRVVVAPVYAPALVVFVGGPNLLIGVGGFAAWFPLGPGEPYNPWYHYGGDYLRQVNVTNVRNVTNITNITNVTNVSNIRYVNRGRAITAVPANVFRNGQPVGRQVLRVPPEQLSKAAVIPHPSVSPTERAASGGRPVAVPPVPVARPAPAARGGQGITPTTPGEVRRSVPPEKPAPAPRTGEPPTPGEVRRNVPPERPSPTPRAVEPPTEKTLKGPAGGPPPTRPPFMTKNPPPSAPVPFPQREKAMSEHPGRPLEPQQRENLRQGKPAGPMRDPENPPHSEATTRPAPRSKPSPEPKGKPRTRPDHNP